MVAATLRRQASARPTAAEVLRTALENVKKRGGGRKMSPLNNWKFEVVTADQVGSWRDRKRDEDGGKVGLKLFRVDVKTGMVVGVGGVVKTHAMWAALRTAVGKKKVSLWDLTGRARIAGDGMVTSVLKAREAMPKGAAVDLTTFEEPMRTRVLTWVTLEDEHVLVFK
jgi:hypothetical protein